jgi:hypothetical protein
MSTHFEGKNADLLVLRAIFGYWNIWIKTAEEEDYNTDDSLCLLTGALSIGST